MRGKPDLPQDYFLHHFNFLIENFKSVYGQSFCADTWGWAHRFSDLSVFEQRFLLRAYSRKPRVYWLSEFNYSDIPDPERVFESLSSNGWLRQPMGLEVYDCLECANKSDLCRWLTMAFIPHKPSMKKAALLKLAYSLPFASLQEIVSKGGPFVLEHRGQFDLLSFLFFGSVRSGLQKFALRDLGIMKTRKRANSEIGRPRFSSSAVATFEMSARSDYEFLKMKSDDYVKVFAEHKVLPKIPDGISEGAGESFNKLVLLVSKNKLIDDRVAEEWLSQATAAPARMSWVRWLHRKGCAD
ncbi:MAG: hypothetical protein AAF202_03800, partial [Pseudomonadota bacterium]